MTTYWITKYALTTGVFSVEGDISSTSDTMIVWIDERGHRMAAHGKDWHLTVTAATIRANQMREAKIASLKRQIAKLDKMKF